jgi:hypothetical protein
MTKQLAKVQEAAPPAETGITSILDKLMANPDLPVERAEQAFQFYLKVEAEQARKAYAAAMVSCQKEVTTVKVNATNSHTKSKYATYEALDKALRPIYSKHGFSISYNTQSPAPEMLRVVAYVGHEGGHEREFSIDMPADGKGAKNNDLMTKTHATGSALSYGKRYLLGAIFNVATSKDDDGNAASGPVGVITGDQAEELAKLITETQTDIAKFLEMGGLESLSDMPANQFAAARALLLKKKGAKV